MKKLFTFLCCIYIFNCYCKAQYIDIPDANFKAKLMAQYPSCFNASQLMDTTCTAITTEDSLDISYTAIYDLTGLHYFYGLKYLDCSNNGFNSVAEPLPAGLLSINMSNTTAHFTTGGFPAGLLYLNAGFCANASGLGLPSSLIYLDLRANMLSGQFPPSMPPNLIYLNLSENPDLTQISGSWPSGLKYLNLAGDQFSSLGTLPPALDTLIVNHQEDIYAYSSLGETVPKLTALPALPATLKYLDCNSNSLSTISNLPAGLTYLDCKNNYRLLTYGPGIAHVRTLTSITDLPASLMYFRCNDNALSSLPSLPASLLFFDCSSNKYYMGYDDYMGNTTYYSSPGFSTFTALPAALEYMNASNNGITSLPQLPNSLVDLTLSFNPISDLPALPPALAYLNVGGTPVYCVPHLPQSFSGHSIFNTFQYNLVVPMNQVNCLPNAVPGIRSARMNGVTIFLQTYPNCNAINNVHGCISNPAVTGHVFYDNNSNGVQDPGENTRSGVKATLDNGQEGFTDINGYYVVSGELGNNTLTIQSPIYYQAVPSTFNYNFNTSDTVVTENIALQPTIVADSMRITISPLNNPRRGEHFYYDVKYENVGTSTVTPDISISFDNSHMGFVSSTNASLINNGNSLTLAPGTMYPGQRGGFVLDFIVSVNTAMGGSVYAQAVVTAGTSTCTDYISSQVIGPMDPNDKQATPALTTQQVSAGAYIDYLIRFQNVGTDTAFNIVITDTLSALLQANTLKIIEASHACKITQDNNKVSFEFLGIKLPDSLINKQASHGYVRFRAKPVSSLAPNTIVTNKASIYFDYNAPVPTGDALTTVNFTVVPVNLSSFNIRKQDATVQLYWSTEQERNSRSFIIERSSTGNKWDVVKNVPAAGNSAQKINYTTTDFNPANGVNYYRLKQVDLDGKFAYSEIRSVYFGNNVNIALIPNPAVDKVTLYLPGNATLTSIEIYNINGQLIRSIQTTNESVQINLADLSKGMYTVKVNGKYHSEVKKLLVQ